MRIMCLSITLMVTSALTLGGSLISASAVPRGWEAVALQTASQVWGASGPCQVCPNTAWGDPLLNAECDQHADCNAPCTQKYTNGVENGCHGVITYGCNGGGMWNRCIWARWWWCWQGAGEGTARCGNRERCLCIEPPGGNCPGGRAREDMGTPCKRDCM